jgi:hypothetical protein
VTGLANPAGAPAAPRAGAELMTGLGYERFGAHGGDWGAFVDIELPA